MSTPPSRPYRANRGSCRSFDAALCQQWSFLQIGWPNSRRLDYSAVGRDLVQVEPLPMGALPIYDKDPDVAACVTGSRREGEG